MRKLLICFIIFGTSFGCSPKLTITDIENRINRDYTAFNEGDVEYFVNNTPKKSLKKYGKEGYRKKLKKIYNEKSDYPLEFSEIGDLHVQDRKKCNSSYYYKVKYIVDKTKMTPYMDSTALMLNYKDYGKQNVSFNTNSKFLQIRQFMSKVLVFDKDRRWKLLGYEKYNIQSLNDDYGIGFCECIQKK